jgi:hypothetical protein
MAQRSEGILSYKAQAKRWAEQSYKAQAKRWAEQSYKAQAKRWVENKATMPKRSDGLITKLQSPSGAMGSNKATKPKRSDGFKQSYNARAKRWVKQSDNARAKRWVSHPPQCLFQIPLQYIRIFQTHIQPH